MIAQQASATINWLTEKFGPALNVAPYGECIVVQGTAFDPDWEAQLGDQGFRCHFGDLDGHAVTFVPLKKTAASVLPAAASQSAAIASDDENNGEAPESEQTYQSTNLGLAKAFDVLIGKVNELSSSVDKRFQILFENYLNLSEKNADLKADFTAYDKLRSDINLAYREEINKPSAKSAVLQLQIGKHKHAISGETMLPMEVS